MNKQEAKEWLSAWFDGAETRFDPEMEEALQLAHSDPELREWLEQQQRMDSVMKDALPRAYPVPEDLEETLLATVGGSGSKRSRMFPRLLWISGIAAAVALAIGSAFFMRQNESLVQDIQAGITGTTPDSFEQFRDGMSYYIRDVYFQLDHASPSLPSIESWLQRNRAPVYESVPGELQALVPLGCKRLKWKGNDVSLVCFNTRDGKIIHLFILERKGKDPDQFKDIEQVRISNGLETGGWLTASKVYLLVGSEPGVDITFALG